MPPEYQRACDEFDRFLRLARDRAGLSTRNQTYTMTQGVFLTFRRRLELREAIAFANVLPPLLRALFVADWDTEQPIQPFTDRATLTREVQSLRQDHNFAPDSAIADVSFALGEVVDPHAFAAYLARLPPEARDFWTMDP